MVNKTQDLDDLQGLAVLVNQVGSLHNEIANIKTQNNCTVRMLEVDKETLKQNWRGEQKRHEETRNLLGATQLEVSELEEKVSVIYSGLIAIIDNSKKARYNPKADLAKVKKLLSTIETK